MFSYVFDFCRLSQSHAVALMETQWKRTLTAAATTTIDIMVTLMMTKMMKVTSLMNHCKER